MKYLLHSFALIALVLPFSVKAEAPDNGLLAQVGHAYELGSGRPIYTEYHYQMFKNGQIVDHHVEYMRPDGTPLATKTLDYSRHRYAPDFQLQDWRDGYLEGAEHTQQGYLLKRRLKADAELTTELVAIPEKLELVADSGFDHYVKAVMPTLLEQGEQRFVMAVAGRLSSFTFEANLIERTELFERPAARIRIQPASLLRLFTGGIHITYDLESGYLLRYEGISNIRDDNGDRYDARIDFPPEERRFSPIGSTGAGHEPRASDDPSVRTGPDSGQHHPPGDTAPVPATAQGRRCREHEPA